MLHDLIVFQPLHRYMDLKRELLAKLDSEKRGLREMSQSEARSRAKMPSRCDPVKLSCLFLCLFGDFFFVWRLYVVHS